jgi:hypothetical protein
MKDDKSMKPKAAGLAAASAVGPNLLKSNNNHLGEKSKKLTQK